MSEQAIILVAALAVPLVVITVLRVNAAMVFLSLCLGAVLVQYVAPQANDLIKLANPHAGAFSASTVELALLLPPAVVTAIVTICSLHGRLRVVLNVLPAAATAALAVLLAVPLLPPHVAQPLEAEQVWKILSRSEALVIGVGALMSLFFLWTQRSFFKQHDKRRH